MTRRTLAMWVLLLAVATILPAQLQQQTVDWQGLEQAWNAYYTNPSESGAQAVIALLPDNWKVLDLKEGFPVINAINDHLGVLEGEIYSGNPFAVRMGFRLYTISYGAFELALNKILGGLIAFNPRLFLEELERHRGFLTTLEPILGSYLRENPGDDVARELERKLRIQALETVDAKELKAVRSECIKILKKL